MSLLSRLVIVPLFFGFISSLSLAKVSPVPGYPEFNTRWDELPDAETAKSFYDFALQTKLDMENNQLDKTLFDGGTTSVFIKFTHKDIKGDWRPPNGAGQIEGIVFAYNLGRLLKVDKHLVKTGLEMHLPASSKDLQSFVSSLKSTSFRGSEKNKNKNNVISLIGRGGRVPGVFSLKPVSDYKYEGLRTGGMGNGQLNTANPIARSLRCDSGSLDGDFTINGMSGKKVNVVKSLSTVFIIDALNMQWDRFSGGNIEYIKHPETGELTFVSHDNGGVSHSYVGLARTYSKTVINQWVSRYDRSVAERIFQVHDFLFNGQPLDQFQSEEQLKLALGVRSDSRNWETRWGSFKTALKELVSVMRKKPSSCYL